MKRRGLFILFELFFIFFCANLNAIVEVNPSESVDRMKWWRESRFGMFIHWGVYSVYGNVYEGVDIQGDSIRYDYRATEMPAEWIMNMAKIPRNVYKEAAQKFDAKDYNPKAWVQLAKDAGMKYIIITSKHHDGFCLFETNYTDWNAVKASGAGRDLLKDLVKEAKAAGLKIGFYYSQNRDWMHEGGMGAIPELNGGLYSAEKVEKYVNELVIPHIKELTDNYDIDIFWYDSPKVENTTPGLAQSVQDALLKSRLGDKIIYNNRLLPDFKGDFLTPETDTPNIPYNGYEDDRDWEACASLHATWGYEPTPDHIWKTPLYTISRIIELASKGGNFLLNVGPDKHGNIPEKAQSSLKEVGQWMSKYGEAVYGTQKNELLNPFPFGYVTQKNNPDGSVNLYLHISSGYWKEAFKMPLHGVMNLPSEAVLLEVNEPVNMSMTADGIVFELPDNPGDPYYSVLKLTFSGKIPQKQVFQMNENKEIVLTPYQMISHGNLKKDYIPYTIKRWNHTGDAAIWNTYLKAGKYTLSGEISAWVRAGEIYFEIEGEKYACMYEKYGDENTYVKKTFFDFFVDKTGMCTIKVNRKAEYGPELPNNNICMRNVVLTFQDNNGIEEPSMNVLIYPNPTEGFFFLETNQQEEISISEMNGRVVLKKEVLPLMQNKIDVSSLSPGVYIVKGKNFARKIIVKKLN